MKKESTGKSQLETKERKEIEQGLESWKKFKKVRWIKKVEIGFELKELLLLHNWMVEMRTSAYKCGGY